MRTVVDSDRHKAPRRRAQQDAADRADLADRLVEIDAHLLGTLPAFLRQALRKEQRRLRAEMQAEGQARP